MRRKLHIVAVSLALIPIVQAGVEKSHSGEYLQISSDCFRMALWTFPEIRSKIALISGFAHLLRKESGGPGKGVGKLGDFPSPQMPERGWARPSLQFRHTPFKKLRKPAASLPQAYLKHTQAHPTLSRPAPRLRGMQKLTLSSSEPPQRSRQR
jgi:hypothetical protein